MSEPERIQEDDDEADPDYVPPMEMENGHITQSSNSNSEVESSSDDEAAGDNTGQFDTDLPTTHKYLGKLNDVSGYTLYDDGEILNILAIYTNTLVFPGFTLPLVMNNHYENSIMQTFIEKNKVFVLLCANSSYSGIFKFGVTMEIFETQMRNNILNIKARGRQRCKLVPGAEVKNLVGRLQQVTVKILAEPPIVSPIADTQMLNLKSKRLHTSSDYNEIRKNYKFRRYHLSQYPLPSWIYDQYEVSFYTKLLLDGLLCYVGEYIPNDPVKLSYWFVQNYQLSHDERLNILKLNTTLERLRLEYKYLKMERKMCCDSCGTEITDPSKVFAMSKDGIQSNYVNPGGHVYETVTVLFAKNFQLIGNPSRQFSWFPGYSWTIMQCSSCNHHIGWRFSSHALRPSCFYGLAKSGFKVVIPEKLKPDDFEFAEVIQSESSSYARDYIGLCDLTKEDMFGYGHNTRSKDFHLISNQKQIVNRSIFHRGVIEFNKLSTKIKAETSLRIFKRKLKDAFLNFQD